MFVWVCENSVLQVPTGPLNWMWIYILLLFCVVPRDSCTDLLPLGAASSCSHYPICVKIVHPTVLVKSFAHLNRNFFLASLEEIDKLWKWWTSMFKVSPPLAGGSQKIHSIKCAKLLASTVFPTITGLIKGGHSECIGLAPLCNPPIHRKNTFVKKKPYPILSP